MAWKRIQVRTIPAEGSVLFEPTTAEISSYIKTNYDDTGKRTSFSVSSGDDEYQNNPSGTIRVVVWEFISIFRDEASRNEFVEDSIIRTEATRRNTINAANGIIREITVDEEVS
jgi:hypothetical protein|tara:strand:- start:310 stop:651 length:342 start_codon:yes stop_codon:yes gene_type:complete